MNPTQVKGNEIHGFAAGTWGGEFHPEFGPRDGDAVLEHWAQSGFANTDLDAQLKQLGIEKIILVGVVANTCIEGTARFGMEATTSAWSGMRPRHSTTKACTRRTRSMDHASRTLF
jgi:hypothetical protein